jgi:hypothetical protein
MSQISNVIRSAAWKAANGHFIGWGCTQTSEALGFRGLRFGYTEITQTNVHEFGKSLLSLLTSEQVFVYNRGEHEFDAADVKLPAA